MNEKKESLKFELFLWLCVFGWNGQHSWYDKSLKQLALRLSSVTDLVADLTSLGRGGQANPSLLHLV
jgi:hypothetical protein